MKKIKILKPLRNFHSSSFVVTDSFHGCVFAILFNKPFFAVGNVNRGFARFESLLELFNLENRLVKSVEDLNETVINEQIDWEMVNQLKIKLVKNGQAFLNKFLSYEI